MAISKKAAYRVAAVMEAKIGNYKATSLTVAIRKIAREGNQSFRVSMERIGKALLDLRKRES